MALPKSPAVVLTRASEDNRPLAEALLKRGVPIQEIPCTANCYREPRAWPGEVAAIAFTSRRGVRGVFRSEAGRAWLAARGAALIAAVGAATAEELSLYGISADLTAEPPRGDVLALTLIARLPLGARVAVVRGDLHASELDERLLAAGLGLLPIEVYENESPPIPALAPFPVAAVFVASPSAAERLLGANPWLCVCPFVAIGATTEAALVQLGVKAIERAGSNPAGWLEVLCRACDRALIEPVVEHHGGNMTKRLRSEELFQKACTLMPGGVSSPVRAFRSVGGTPVYFERANGSRFRDVDGNEYVDFCMSWGPLILGHAHPAVIEAVQRAAAEGLSFGACSAREVRLAELVLAAFPGHEQVRFVSSGTEAVMTALRLCRGVTARPKILKFEGGYHGHSDSLLVKAGSGLATFGTSSSAGVPASFAAETIVLPFDDEAALEAAFARHGPELAAAVVEPLPANNGLLEQRPAWLERLRALCDRYGALLVFDEVISGFRLRFGGYGDMLGVRADLVTLGKIIGGGMPVGAIVGPRRIMEALAPLGPVYQAGTLSGNPVSLAAGIATLERLQDAAVYSRLETLGRKLDMGLETRAIGYRRVGSIAWLYLARGEVPRAAAAIDPTAMERFRPLHAPLLERGIYLPPSAYEVFFLSAAHTEADVDRLCKELGLLLQGGA